MRGLHLGQRPTTTSPGGGASNRVTFTILDDVVYLTDPVTGYVYEAPVTFVGPTTLPSGLITASEDTLLFHYAGGTWSSPATQVEGTTPVGGRILNDVFYVTIASVTYSMPVTATEGIPGMPPGGETSLVTIDGVEYLRIVFPDGEVRYEEVHETPTPDAEGGGGTFGVYDVRDYGAVGTGDVSDQPAFEALAAALPTTGAEVVIPPGIYKLTAAWTLSGKNNLRITGSGQIKQTGTNVRCLSLVNCTNVSVEGVSFYGLGTDFNPLATTNGSGIYAEGCVDLRVANCRFENFGYAGIVWTNSRLVNISHNHVKGTGLANIVPANQDNYQFGIATYGNTALAYPGVIISHNIIEETCQGIITAPDQSDILIEGNVIKNIRGQHGMYLCGGCNGVVLGNSIENTNLIGIKLVNQSNLGGGTPSECLGWAIEGNTIRNTGSWGIIVGQQGANYPTQDYCFRGLRVTDNLVLSAGAGITVRDSIDADVSDNTIVNVLDYGIYLLTFDGRAKGNWINKCTASGIFVSGRASGVIAILANRITSPATSGVGGANPAAQGIYIDGSVAGTFDLSDNKIFVGTGLPARAIWIVPGASTVNLSRNASPTLGLYDGVTDHHPSSIVINNAGKLVQIGAMDIQGLLTVPDDAYDATSWNGNLSVPTKNAVRDALIGLGGGGVATSDSPTWSAAHIFGVAGAADTPAIRVSGTPFSGGTATTTKPQMLLEPAGTTSTGWSTLGTMLGVNAPAGFAGNLIDLKVNGGTAFKVDQNGTATVLSSLNCASFQVSGNAAMQSTNGLFYWNGGDLVLGRIGPQNFRLGLPPTATPLAQTFTIGEASRPGTDSNVAGANGTIQSGLGTGTGAASSLIFQTPTVAGAGSGVQTYATRMTLDATGATFPGSVTSGGNVLAADYFSTNVYDLAMRAGYGIRIGSSLSLGWSNTNNFTSALDLVLRRSGAGILLVGNADSPTDFSRLQLGGTTASFPAIKRSGAGLAIRLADDTADGALSALSFQSAAPSGGTSGVWKLGSLVTAAVTPDTSRYIQLDVGGTLYKVIIST